MSQILPIGGLQKTDKNGFIIGKPTEDDIKTPWKEVVSEIRNAYLQEMHPSIHSLYVRGSVAFGNAIEGISDIDTLAVIFGQPSKTSHNWSAHEKERLEKKFDFVTSVDLQFISYDKLMHDFEAFNDRFTIKTQSVCVYGKDLAGSLPTFKADLETARKLRSNLKGAIQHTLNNIINNPHKPYIKEWCRWIMKVLIRSGFLLVMDKEQSYTRDLYPCYTLFFETFSRTRAKNENGP